MKELVHHLFNPPSSVEAICIPTNGIYTKSRGAIMGKGVALAAAQRWPLIKFILANKLEKKGNRVHILLEPYEDPYKTSFFILSFPTKEHWRDDSSQALVERSTADLVNLTNRVGWKEVWLPRPGCGCGGLQWKNIKEILNRQLDNRFTVVYLQEWEQTLERSDEYKRNSSDD